MIDSTLNYSQIIKIFKIDLLMKQELARRPCLNPTVKMHYEHASAAETRHFFFHPIMFFKSDKRFSN